MASQCDKTPNIILITLHDLGRHLRCYDAHLPETPAIERIGAEGVVFDNHFSTSPFCSPARASIQTGRYPHSNGMNGLTHCGFKLKDTEKCIPHYLNDGGCHTVLIGLQHEAHKDPGRLGYKEIWRSADGMNFCHDVAPAVCDFLKRGPKAPFFLSVGFFEVHREYTQAHVKPIDPAQVRVPSYLTDCPDVRQDLADFYGMVKTADREVGRILDALDETGLGDDTLLLFTTDHGAAFPRAKSTLYDTGIGVTLLARWPGRIQPGGRVRGLTSHVDLLPTLLEVAGREVPEEVQGRSLLSLLNRPDGPGRECIFAEKSWHGNEYDPMRCIRTERYKYIRNFTEGWLYQMPMDIKMAPSGRVMEPTRRKPRPEVELYDLRADPEERNNLAEDPRYREVQADLSRRLTEWQGETGDALPARHIPWTQPGKEHYLNNMLQKMPAGESRTLPCGG